MMFYLMYGIQITVFLLLIAAFFKTRIDDIKYEKRYQEFIDEHAKHGIDVRPGNRT